MYERRLYGRIRPQDCLEYVKRQQGGGAERLVDFCKTHDRLANWVKSSVLEIENVGRRAHTIDLWIRVAEASDLRFVGGCLQFLTNYLLVHRDVELSMLFRHSAPLLRH